MISCSSSGSAVTKFHLLFPLRLYFYFPLSWLGPETDNERHRRDIYRERKREVQKQRDRDTQRSTVRPRLFDCFEFFPQRLDWKSAVPGRRLGAATTKYPCRACSTSTARKLSMHRLCLLLALVRSLLFYAYTLFPCRV